MKDRPPTVTCTHCSSDDTFQVITEQSIRLSGKSKVEKLDPKYDGLIDKTIEKNPLANPDRYINRRGDPSKGR